MTRKEELNEAWCKYRGKCSTEIMQALAFALRWCDEHPNWISVEDALPPADDRDDESDDCLFVEEDGNIDIGYYNQMDETWFTRNGGIRAVTHWQPLPAPPKKGGEL